MCSIVCDWSADHCISYCHEVNNEFGSPTTCLLCGCCQNIGDQMHCSSTIHRNQRLSFDTYYSPKLASFDYFVRMCISFFSNDNG